LKPASADLTHGWIQERSAAVWQIREDGRAPQPLTPGAPAEWEGWDDAAGAPEKMGGLFERHRKLMNEYG